MRQIINSSLVTEFLSQLTKSTLRQSPRVPLFHRSSYGLTYDRLSRSPGFAFASMAARQLDEVGIATGGDVKHVYDRIVKPEKDKREFRGLQLANGMKALLISDPETDKASAALDVYVGHLADPWELPGLAHFCEHMLFLGTEKYPVENDYNKFLQEHGGSSNAFTGAEHTNYYFDVSPDHLEAALDRFSQFFLCPLFTPSATSREVNAVNSENEKNLQSDAWRLFQLEKASAKEGHDWRKFGTGNKQTLETDPEAKGIKVHQALLDFHAKHYSSNIMGISVLGKEPLDQLQELVVTNFSKVENKNVEIMEWKEHPYGKDEVGMKGEVVPVKDLRNLNISFPIPDLHKHWRSSPGHYLGHLIGHEGPGSLLSELKKRGWVSNLTGGCKAGANGFMFFIVNVDLSEEGIDHVDDIVTLVFQYLNMLRQAGPQEWVFEECKNLGEMSFRFKDKERPRSLTSNTAGSLFDYPVEDVISGSYILHEFRPDLIEDVMSRLIPENVRIAVIGRKFQGTTDKTEPWYGTEYSISKIPLETIESWKSAGLHDSLRLPDKNDFIPTNFELAKPEDNEESLPKIVYDSARGRMWFKRDDKFLMPKASLNFELRSPFAYTDPLNVNLNFLFVSLFQDALNEWAYAADIAGLGYSLENSIYGLYLGIRGYNDKQNILLDKLINKMVTFEIDPKRYEIIKEKYHRALVNFKADQPHQHAIYYTSVLMAEQMWTKEELLKSLEEEVTMEKLKLFIPKLMSRLYVEGLSCGNITSQEAKIQMETVISTLQSKVGTKPLHPAQHKRLREVALPDQSSFTYERTNDVHPTSSVEIYFQCGMQSSRENALIELFCQIVNEPCFDQLRTKEQLGYIVFSGVRRSNGAQGVRVIVQSDRSPSYVNDRVEAFLAKMGTEILDGTLTQEQFENHVSALATKRLEKPKKLSAQAARWWSEIISQQFNFDRDVVEVEALRTLSINDVRNFFKAFIAPDAPQRRKMAILISPASPVEKEPAEVSAEDLPPAPDGLQLPTTVSDVTAFKHHLPLFPHAKPFLHIPKITTDCKCK